MANHGAPQVTIMLDKERRLKFDFNAAANFEDVTGKSVFAGNVLKELNAKDIRAFMWSCLVHEDKELTLEQVGEMIHMGNIGYVSDKFLAIYNASTPQPEEGKDRPLAQ